VFDATVPGVGVSTTGLDLVMANGISICSDDATVTKYGEVSCWTKKDQLEMSAISLTQKGAEAPFACGVADACNYE
jgi:hypothetical protein